MEGVEYQEVRHETHLAEWLAYSRSSKAGHHYHSVNVEPLSSELEYNGMGKVRADTGGT